MGVPFRPCTKSVRVVGLELGACAIEYLEMIAYTIAWS